MSYTTSYKNENQRARQLRRAAGQYLRGLRQDAKLTQHELARRVGYEYYTFVSQIETGAARVPPTDYAMWANALHVDLAELVKMLLSFYDPHTYAALFGGREQGSKQDGTRKR